MCATTAATTCSAAAIEIILADVWFRLNVVYNTCTRYIIALQTSEKGGPPKLG